jgi:predicted nucleotidyltransferase component of viral defense system
MVEPLERRIRVVAAQSGVPRDVVEKDYAIGHVLAAVYGHPHLGERLVFKGGTALRKAHFPGYRFSEDLDFSALPGTEDLEPMMSEVADAAERTLLAQGAFSISATRYPTRDPHPGGQEAFRLHVQFPWQPRALCSLKLEITADEPVLVQPVRLPLVHGYDEDLAGSLTCYALEEVVAEKLRALLQTRARLATRGWARPRSRDYYDLWQLLCARPGAVRFDGVSRILSEKCAVRDVSFSAPEDFLRDDGLERARLEWAASLGRMVVDLPDFDACLQDLQQPVGTIVGLALAD